MATSIVSNSTASTFTNSPQKTGEPVDRLKIYSGKALEFDGVSDYITASPDFLVNSTATTAMTVAVWVNVDDISSNQDVIAVFDTNQNSKFLGNYNGSISFTMYNNDYSDILGQKTDDVVLVEGQWHRIVATYDGSQTDAGFKIYMDGALIASSASNSIFSANLTTDLTIGRTNRTSGSTNDFAGKMSDFQVWDTVWSLADVTYDYLNPEKLITSQNPTNDLVSNLRVWYPMNDTGTTNPQTVVFDAANSGGLTSNYVSSSSFDSDSGWSLGTNWSINKGKLIGSSNNANANLVGLGFEANLIYKVVYSITSYTSGQVRATVAGGQSGTYRSGVGTYTEYLPAGSTGGNFTFRGNPSNSFTGEIDDLTIQKVKQGYHGTTIFLGDDKLGGNGGFDATSNWSVVSGSVGTEWTINDSSNSKAVHNTSNANTLRYTGSSGDLVDGTTYQVDFTIADRTAGSITIAIGGSAASSSQTESGSIELTAGGSSSRIIDINPTSDFDGSIDSVTVKEVGIATGWTKADQQQYIPQTAFMDGCTKNNFDGVDDYISLGNADSLNNIWDGGGSVSAWIFPTALPSGNGTRILCKKQEGHVGWFIALSDLSGSTCDLNFRIDWDGDNYDINTSNRDITLNQWNHIVVVYNSDSTSNTASIFINGSSKTITSDTPTGTRDDDDNKELRIGGQLNSGGSAIIFPFEGIIDDVSIFSSSLTETQAQELYNNGLPLNATKHSQSNNLIGYFKNNNLNSEGKWKDQISTNHGTINGTPDHIFFQQGVTANLCTQGYSNNIVHPSKGSIHFLGQEYAQFPGERIINLDGDFTIEFWAKKTQLHPGGLTDNMLFGSGSNQIRIPDGVGSGKMANINYRDAGVNSSLSIHSDNRKSLYEWFHVAIVKESGTITSYIDTANTGNGTLFSTGQQQIKLIGGYSVALNYMYKGFLDDLRIYDKALSAAEITKNYKNGKSQHKNS